MDEKWYTHEFEVEWPNISQEFGVDPRSWLYKMYEKREHWVNFFLKDIFWAGMTTKGRSESMNAFLMDMYTLIPCLMSS